MSGEYANLLRRRALAYMRVSERLLGEGEYDLAVFNCEYAVQLYIKSLLYRLTGEEWRGHGIRALLGLLASILEQEGYRDYAVKVMDFVRKYRRVLAEIEEAHTRAVYGPITYSREQAELLIRNAKEVIELLKRIEKGVFSSVS
ncbi:MAG: HEPN domain-containing protein [Thermoprotei archaeon]